MQMMFKQAKFKTGYVAEAHTQVLELPYAGQELSLVVLLPDDDTELAVVSPGWASERLWTRAQLMSSCPSVH